MRESRRADLALVWFVAAVGDEIDPELALRRLDRGVDLAGRDVEALSVQFEMMDQGFHRALHLAAPRRHDLVVRIHHGPLPLRRAQLLQTLFHDPHRLAHFFHADAVTVVAVAVLADRNIEIHFRVALVGLRLAQVPGRARAAHHHAGKAPGPGILELDHADVDVALLEDPIVGQQAFDVVADLEKRIAERPDVVDELFRQILVDAADAEIGGMHAAARGALVEPHQLLALFETPQRRRERADVHRLGGDVEEMREQPADLAIEHANELGSPRHLDAEQALRGETECMFLVHRRDVVEPVEIGDRLQIGLLLDQLLGAPMQEPDVRIDALDYLAVELEYQAQHAVRRRMLRPEIDGEIAQRGFGHFTCRTAARMPPLIASWPSWRLGLFVARQHVLRPFPRREEIEIPEFLRQPHRVVDHALEFVVPTHFDEAGQRKILAQWMALETVVGQQPPQVRMAREQHAVEIIDLALEPVGPAIDGDDRGHRRRLVGLHFDPDALVPLRRKQMVNHIEALLALRPIDRGDVDDAPEQATLVVAQELHHANDIGDVGGERELPERDRMGARGSAERRNDGVSELFQRFVHAAGSYASALDGADAADLLL